MRGSGWKLFFSFFSDYSQNQHCLNMRGAAASLHSLGFFDLLQIPDDTARSFPDYLFPLSSVARELLIASMFRLQHECTQENVQDGVREGLNLVVSVQ